MKLETFLLRLYPREWRARYEDEFTALLEQSHTSLLDVADVALGALDAHLRPQLTATGVSAERRLFMNRATFTQWGGMAAMVGSVLLLLGMIGSSVFSDDDYPYTYGAEDVVASALLLVGSILMLVGVAGFGFAYARRSGGLGQVALLVALTGLIGLTTGSIGSVMETVGADISGWWTLLMLGLIGLFVGMTLFAIAGARHHILAAMAVIPIVAGGIGGLAVIALSIFVPDINEGAIGTTLIVLFMSAIVLFLAGFFLLGSALWGRRGSAARQVGPASVG